MKAFFTCFSIILLLSVSIFSEAKPIKILVYSKTNGFRHKTIPTAIAALTTIAKDNNWKLTFTEDSLLFSKRKKLKKYKVVLFLYTTGKVFGNEEESAFKEYIEKGGALVTIHTGTDCEQNWDWYINAVGAKFKNHPKQQQAKFIVQDSVHISTNKLPKEWLHFDEIYNYAAPVVSDAHVLLTVDESSYTGGAMGALHPIAWYKNINKGRVFQTALGHTDACYTDKDFINHLVGGIKWAIK
jgi:type 1 glutamine amidotransferase